MRPELLAFIAHARERGMDHATIRMLLLSAGWKEKDVSQALTEQALELEVPEPPDRGGAREAFQHLLAFASLYAWALAVVFMLLRFVDWYLPDPADPEIPERYFWSAVRWQLAFVLVSFPAFLVFTRATLREIERAPERAQSPIRKWLTYLTLFSAALALGGDLIALVFRFLEGELTLRFLLKVLIVLTVAGGVFVYYLTSVADDGGRRRFPRLHRTFALAATVFVGLAWIWGMALAGSPGLERQRRLDDRRIDDLRAIESEIETLCVEPTERGPTLKRPLPADLEEVGRLARRERPGVRDPRSGEPYGYEPGEAGRYRLCATFEHERRSRFDPFWDHPAGRHCFEINALE